MMTTPLKLTHLQYEVAADGVATVLVDRKGERMNTISPALFTDMTTVVDRLENDPDVVAVVLGSAKPDNFISGADIRWLETLDDKEAILSEFQAGKAVLLRLEALSREHGKPVVAAIHGPCLGGGLEVALTASMRICSDDERTQLGQPEIKLGLIPAGGATQRLPRLVGIAKGLDMILGGRAVRPDRALKMGLVDEVVPAVDLLATARDRALAAARGDIPKKKSEGALSALRAAFSGDRLQRAALETTSAGRRVLFSKAEQAMHAETRGNYPAAPAALRAVRAGYEQGFEAGLDAEIAEFAEVAVTPEAKALISLFFASQELRKDTGITTEAVPRPVAQVGVLGGGLMGGGIAAVNTTRAGVRTRIRELDDAGVARGLGHVSSAVTSLTRRGRLPKADADRALTLVTATTGWDGFGDCDIVIEAVFEDLDLKRQMLAGVEGHARNDTIFASNTSSIPIAHIAANAARPEQVIGMHYFSPVEKMPLLEIVTTDTTADWVTATCVAFGKQQAKTVIVVNDGPGFYTTRVLAPYANEVFHLLAEGARIEAIDDAMVRWGFPVGPMTLSDEVGIDVQAKIAKIMHAAFADRFELPAALDRLVEDDRKGRKNGRGYYRYEDGERTGVDETVYDVLGISTHTTPESDDIQERLALQFANEAALCLQEGILRSARDGDIGAVYGLGFPPFRGGPFSWIDSVGAAGIVSRMEALAVAHGPRFEPAAILRDHAESGEPFRAR
jgi:3-hydroxyacyl-CoA dehydrogenase/enoyl-CoA hydratase/3-hydroxybutyryl-CoA epimerase